jgi:NitT/TauT family transport system permease protein
MTRTSERLMPWMFMAVLLLVWEGSCVLFHVPVFILPRPSVIVATFIKDFQPIAENSLQTLMTTLLGFALAVVLGAALGLVIGASRAFYNGIYPILVGFNSIPKVAVVPVLVLWFGIGTVPAILTAFLVSFFPISVNVATGLATIEPELLDVLRSLGARKRHVIMKIGVPRALPYFFASLKVAITLAFVGAIISETVAANKGIGYLMIVATSTFDTPLVFAGLLTVAAMGIVLYALFAVVEKRTTFWAQRGGIA